MVGLTNVNDTLKKENHAWYPKMIVFDKDGTLGDCTQALHTWCKRMTRCLIEECRKVNLDPVQAKQLVRHFHSAAGWNPVNECLLPSSFLSSGTWAQILDATAVVLEKFGNGCIVDPRKRVEYWHNNLGDIHANDEPLVADLQGFMAGLKNQYEGIIIAVCTSDDRRSTNACIKNWGLEDLVDLSICGDEVSEAKPSAQPLVALCKQARVSPQDCVIVGDTSADTGMGRNANAGLIVGVLTGTGTADYLFDNGADAIIPHIGYLSRLFGFPTTRDRSSSDITVSTTSSACSSSTIEGDYCLAVGSHGES